MTKFEADDVLRARVLLDALKDVAKFGTVKALPVGILIRHLSQVASNPAKFAIAKAISDDQHFVPGPGKIFKLGMMLKCLNDEQFSDMIYEIKGGSGSGFSGSNRCGIPGKRGGSMDCDDPRYSQLKADADERRAARAPNLEPRGGGLTLTDSGFSTFGQADFSRPAAMDNKVTVVIEQEIERNEIPQYNDVGEIAGYKTQVIARIRQKIPVDPESAQELYMESTRGNNGGFMQLMEQVSGKADHGFDDGVMNASYIDSLLSKDLYADQTMYLPSSGRQDDMSPFPAISMGSMDPVHNGYAMPLNYDNEILGGHIAPEIGYNNNYARTDNWSPGSPMMLGNGSG